MLAGLPPPFPLLSASTPPPNPYLTPSLSLMAPASALQSSKTVCVMDASGRLGEALVEKLLKRGYTVHAVTCNHGELQCLRARSLSTSDNKQQLKAFHSDTFDYHSIFCALRGCSGLFYCFEENSSYDEFMAEMEVRAAHNVLEACAQTDTMEKVIFTSSITAVVWKDSRKKPAGDLDERDWSEPNFCRKFKLWHALAKTLAEKTAWALAMDRGVHMLSINAGLLTGPELTAKNPYLKGAPEMYRDGVLVTVDVEFLVDAHICTFEASSAYGRYLCFNHVICRPEDAVKLVHMLAPSPAACPPPSGDELRVIQQRIHNKKLKKAMVEFYGDGDMAPAAAVAPGQGMLQ